MEEKLRPGHYFKKKAIPCRVRVALAVRYGCFPGERAPAKCHYCDFMGMVVWHRGQKGQPTLWVTFPDLEMDHIIPEVFGGSSEENNLVLACRPCNRKKGFRVEACK